MNSLESNLINNNIKCEKELYLHNNLTIKGNLKVNNILDEKYSILNSNYLQWKFFYFIIYSFGFSIFLLILSFFKMCGFHEIL